MHFKCVCLTAKIYDCCCPLFTTSCVLTIETLGAQRNIATTLCCHVCHVVWCCRTRKHGQWRGLFVLHNVLGKAIVSSWFFTVVARSWVNWVQNGNRISVIFARATFEHVQRALLFALFLCLCAYFHDCHPSILSHRHPTHTELWWYYTDNDTGRPCNFRVSKGMRRGLSTSIFAKRRQSACLFFVNDSHKLSVNIGINCDHLLSMPIFETANY